MNTHVGALQLVASTLAEAIRPRPPVPFRKWLEENIVLVDGTRKGESWSLAEAPYLGDIADCLSQEDPCNLVTVRKAQQTGVSILALAWTLYIAESCPDNVLYGVPGKELLQDIAGQKLQPLIEAWQAHTGKEVIYPTTSRSHRNSTIYDKRFAGGYISLANANTVTELSMKTCRYGIKDEVSKWETLPNGADPENLFLGRFTAFRRHRNYKIFELSTPELDAGGELGEEAGHCRIDRSFRHSDQRYWHIACPQCAESFVQGFEHFAIDRVDPDKSTMICPSCGYPVSEIERVVAMRSGRFVPTVNGPDRHPGFHVDAFMSLMMSYGAIARDFLKDEGQGESGAKDFSTVVLALPYKMRGNAPDYQRLMERREDYKPYIVPEAGLIFVAGADVQHSGIFVEAIAFAEDRQSWTIAAEYFEGATDDANEGAWEKLDGFFQTLFEDMHGHERTFDAFAVDSSDGNRTNQVLEWCRRRRDCYAIKGVPGQGVPAIGAPRNVSVTKRGKRRKFGSARQWPVGTFALKAEFYGNLHKQGLAAGEAADPPGYCHFYRDLGEEYFRQITAEHFEPAHIVKGRYKKASWEPLRRDNHFLDCRVYAMAMAEQMGLSRMTASQWATLRAQRNPGREADLLSSEPERVAAGHGVAPAQGKKPRQSLAEIAAKLNS